ncbi:hypothetical protein EW146_g4271 [Bondarzewia mesenterica]|uniref:Protein kinase domain-containing protein n=1 Tax=Bondarzewia mesenterica TaxID=1095465 RepID=A0A4V6S1G7_9AGAM|nr:hypothetical protein EW146_g4271 [Bondarzewia mesenterica]
MSRFYDSDTKAASNPSSSSSSEDEDDVNARVRPDWEIYRDLLEHRGFHLDTVRDVKQFYEGYWGDKGTKQSAGYSRACGLSDDAALCKDPGLHDNLFRGHQIKDNTRIVVKAVHLHSRELEIIRLLSSPPVRDHPMNHCIPVLDLIEARDDKIAFIVMEEWSSQLIPETPCCLRLFLIALRTCIEHITFMHLHRIAHLDISLRNLVTDYKGQYACIDFELSRHFKAVDRPRIRGIRSTEIPPELERGDSSDPFKVDVWALAMLIVRACHSTGYVVPELVTLTVPMFNEEHSRRPTALDVLTGFDSMIRHIGDARLREGAKRTTF